MLSDRDEIAISKVYKKKKKKPNDAVENVKGKWRGTKG